MKTLKFLGFAAVLVLLPQVCHSTPAKHIRKLHDRVRQAPPVINTQDDMVRANAALGGNNASSAFGTNSANENANGRSGGGFGG